ncbi:MULTISPECIES: hypothetical protein [Streptomyces]|uniref:hypothetical protein n=1 Tax=Streptomyces TaxID=1883 RepID=UPI000DD5D2DB|nr:MULTISPECIES: hypothetical protein [Streptomyces]MDX3381614.1 hypothetical protein [Streptomyces niveiscabiei]QZZ26795.1 hypothetical protein A7X85_11505 [Streptomyces sp. ST1015]
MPNHDHDTPYAETDTGPAPTPFTHHTSPDGETLTLRGTCPRCQGPTASHYAYGLPGTGTKGLFGRRTPPPTPESALLQEIHYCECGHPHPQLPPDVPFIGCGASWTVTNLQAGTP